MAVKLLHNSFVIILSVHAVFQNKRGIIIVYTIGTNERKK